MWGSQSSQLCSRKETETPAWSTLASHEDNAPGRRGAPRRVMLDFSCLCLPSLRICPGLFPTALCDGGKSPDSKTALGTSAQSLLASFGFATLTFSFLFKKG